jgi:hypothetical protein
MDDWTKTAIALWTVAVVGLTTVSLAQTHGAMQRFTFGVENASKAGLSPPGRLQLVINRWSTDAEREGALLAMKEDGPDGLAREIRSSGAVGYLHWPGSLDYTLRYAYHVPRPEGGQDLVLATDSPVQQWWESGHSMPASNSGITVIQLRLNNDGQGEGKLAMPTKVTAGRDAKTFLLDDYDKQPVVLTDVRRDRVTG